MLTATSTDVPMFVNKYHQENQGKCWNDRNQKVVLLLILLTLNSSRSSRLQTKRRKKEDAIREGVSRTAGGPAMKRETPEQAKKKTHNSIYHFQYSMTMDCGKDAAVITGNECRMSENISESFSSLFFSFFFDTHYTRYSQKRERIVHRSHHQ